MNVDKGFTLPFDKLDNGHELLKESFRSAEPWPHIVLDDFFESESLDLVLTEFAQVQSNWKSFDTKYEAKHQMNQDQNFGPYTRSIFHALNSAPFLEFLSKVTGIERLVSDPYLVGGGYHQIPKGGKLGVHVDFNKHEQLGLYRRLNVIIYLNKNWDESFGGHFQLWSNSTKKCEKKVLPKFNRMAIFETTNSSFHGHPEPLGCPDGVYRRSLALYYYSPDRGAQNKKSHSTIFMTEDGKLDDLQGPRTVKSFLRNNIRRIKKTASN